MADKGLRTRAVCVCGLSKDLPWCDGAHAGTGKKPRLIQLPEGVDKMCDCGNTTTFPFCDGSDPSCDEKSTGEKTDGNEL